MLSGKKRKNVLPENDKNDTSKKQATIQSELKNQQNLQTEDQNIVSSSSHEEELTHLYQILSKQTQFIFQLSINNQALKNKLSDLSEQLAEAVKNNDMLQKKLELMQKNYELDKLEKELAQNRAKMPGLTLQAQTSNQQTKELNQIEALNQQMITIGQAHTKIFEAILPYLETIIGMENEAKNPKPANPDTIQKIYS